MPSKPIFGAQNLKTQTYLHLNELYYQQIGEANLTKPRQLSYIHIHIHTYTHTQLTNFKCSIDGKFNNPAGWMAEAIKWTRNISLTTILCDDP